MEKLDASSKGSAYDIKEAPAVQAGGIDNKPDVTVVPFEAGGAGGDALAELRHGPNKHLSKLALLGLSFAILNTWAAASISLYVGIANGGSISLIYGMITATICGLCVAQSLSELCHVFPTAGAQYHWQFALSNPHSTAGRFGTYMSGFFGASGWIVLASSGQNLVGSYVQACITLFHPDYEPKNWVVFLVYIGITAYSLFVVIFSAKIIDRMNKTALVCSFIGAVVVFVVLLACSGAHNTLRDGKWIFATFTNETGWSDGICWILELLNAQFALVGCDAAAHLVNEVPSPSWDAPLAMVASCIMGGVTGLLMIIAFLASITDAKAALSAQGGAFLVILDQAIQSKAGAIILSLFVMSSLIFTVPAINLTANHMVCALGRDNALPFGSWLGRMSDRWEMPVNAAYFTCFWLEVLGCLSIAPPSILSGIQSCSVVLLQMSYMPCIMGMLLWGRNRMDQLGMVRRWSMGKWGGILANGVAISYQCVTIVFFLFPSEPITSANISAMNWVVAVVGVIVVLSLLNWIGWAVKVFKGPSEFISGEIRFQGLYTVMD